MLRNAVIFWQPEGHRAQSPHSPAKKESISADVTLGISLRASGFKEEAECCAQVVQAGETQVTPAPIGTNHLKETIILYRGCHALCTPDVAFLLPINIGISHSTHFTTCACTVIGRLIFLRGE